MLEHRNRCDFRRACATAAWIGVFAGLLYGVVAGLLGLGAP